MNIIDVIDTTPFENLLEEDINGREINIYKLSNVCTSVNTFYPNCLFHNNVNIFNPSSEKVMSLDNEVNYDSTCDFNDVVKASISNPVFFFVYNTDNYYHFVYDSLPYLISFLELRKRFPTMKLLMNYPNSSKKTLYPFVVEFLELLDIFEIEIVSKNSIYENLYISSSYTHGIDSNLPPRKEIYEFFSKIVKIAYKKSTIKGVSSDKIYISRRSWIHGDLSNIGTNYTNRRKLENENELVDCLSNIGFLEVFAEKLSIIEKIIYFNNASTIVGSIGGGLCNVLFSKKGCKLVCICSPTFMEINSRFKYCFSNLDVVYFEKTFHTENTLFKKYMRIKSDTIIGEIEEVYEDSLLVSYTDEKVAGWNSEMKLNKIEINKRNCTKLDNGLNSSWNFNINDLIKIL